MEQKKKKIPFVPKNDEKYIFVFLKKYNSQILEESKVELLKKKINAPLRAKIEEEILLKKLMTDDT